MHQSFDEYLSHDYLKHRVRLGQDSYMEFFAHSTLSVADAMRLLLSKYTVREELPMKWGGDC
jgi:hypothetical protein